MLYIPDLIKEKSSEMITTAIFNRRGGCGKSTLCVNLAAALYRFHKKKILVMDCDAQNNSSEYLMRLGISDGTIPEDFRTIADYLQGRCSIEDMIYTVEVKDSRKIIRTSIDVIPSGEDIDDIEFDSIEAYKHILEKIPGDYDYCLIDCPPQKMPTALTSICAADYILIPIWTENDSSFSGYGMAVDLVNNFRENQINETLKILGLVVTKTKFGRSSLDKYMLEQSREQFSDLLFDTKIRDAQAINDAYMMRTPVVYLRKNSPVANDYKKLSGEFIKRIEEANRKAGV